MSITTPRATGAPGAGNPEGGLSDGRLVATVAETLAVPRAAPADSFVLHAPLELVARAALLPSVRPDERDRARRHLGALAEGFAAAGAPVEPPRPAEYESIEEATLHLVDAIDRGELDDVDVAATWLGRRATGRELRAGLAGPVLPRLAAAAHAPILLFQLPRTAPRREVTGELLRGVARELARRPDWRIHWIERSRPDADAAPEAMFEALATTPMLAAPGATPFIYPLMSRVDDDGIAARQLGRVTGGAAIDELGRAVLRAAAWSMLLEPDDHAPYGWSHCLTMPQAVLGIADATVDPAAALAVAATYVVGFRASLARRPLDPVFPADDPGIPLREALGSTPAIAAAAAWHSPAGARAELVTELATRASIQADAHLVKYTLACFDAAADDRAHERLYLAAAASLVGWWARLGA